MSEERVIAAALSRGGLTISAPPPARHGNLIAQLAAIGGASPRDPVGPKDQGFLTSAGRFVRRIEAMAIARAAGQLLRPDDAGRRLFSEDLW